MFYQDNKPQFTASVNPTLVSEAFCGTPDKILYLENVDRLVFFKKGDYAAVSDAKKSPILLDKNIVAADVPSVFNNSIFILIKAGDGMLSCLQVSIAGERSYQNEVGVIYSC